MYDTVKLIFEKDGEEVCRAEVSRYDNPDDTADYVTQHFWILHTSEQKKLKVKTQLQDEDE